MRQAVFMDRDGTVSEETGYTGQVEHFRLYPCAAPAIRRLNQAGLRVILVTNQSGVARGYFSENAVQRIHATLQQELAREGACLDAIYYCPHHPEGTVSEYRRQCDCRKPGPGMLERAAREFDLDLAASFMVGDRYRDLETGFRAGARSILVLSGYGEAEYASDSQRWRRQPDYVARDLSDAAEWIISIDD
jgi:D-glycero-D-manno-heptose 1,7-bisphosphate phosphatase